MQLMSVIFDPKYAFLIYSPIAYLCDHRVGKNLILTTVIAEWLNMILKWLLHGERPYWYVHSSGHFDPQQVPIKQFPITCELGPGHPSGHAMVTAAVWYIILDSLLQAFRTYTNKNLPTLAKPITWAMYVGLLVSVSVSRVFLGCHFPHQCVAGALLGLMVAKWVSSLEIKPKHFVFTGFFLILSAFATFGLLQLMGFDPAWTIRLATKHCEKREYIHLDTAPFFSIMRYSGFALGCGLGLLLPFKSYAKQLMPSEGQVILLEDNNPTNKPISSRNLYWFSLKILMALLLARQVDNLGQFVSHTNLPVFYSSAFLAYTLFSCVIVAV